MSRKNDVSEGIQGAKRKQDSGMAIAVLSICISIPVWMAVGTGWGVAVMVGGVALGTLIGYR